MLAPEEALLAGGFEGYAMRRLAAFVLSRSWGVGLHVLELTWLAEIFSAKAFIASLALQNGTLVLDAAYWGALEGLRRRARELGPGSEATALVTRWLTAALWTAVAIALVPLARAVWGLLAHESVPSMLHVYALACAVRLGADVVVRTYYSGVFAYGRVHRPLWSIFAGPAVLVFGTLALWPALAGWSFPLALVLSVAVSRGLLFRFTRRAYVLRRIPAPTLRLRFRTRAAAPATHAPAMWRPVLGAAVANVATRLGGVVLLAAVVPSLAVVDDAEVPTLAPFALALHLAAPLLLLAGQWGMVFYHDWKRVDGELSRGLARRLHWRLVGVAVGLGALSWASAAALVLSYVSFAEAWATLLALLPGAVGLSVWTALQLRSFSRGEFGKQVASAGAMLLVLGLALWPTFWSTVWPATSADGAPPFVGPSDAVESPAGDVTGAGVTGTAAGPIAWYLALAAGPWIAIALTAMLELWRDAHTAGQVDTLATWLRALDAARGPIVVWRAEVARDMPRVAIRVAKALGTRGAVVRTRKELLWFERALDDGPGSRLAWLGVGGGTFTRLEACGRGAGKPLASQLRAEDLAEGEARALATLRETHACLFPEGFVVALGGRPPARFLALAPALRLAIWRDAVRNALPTRGRGRSGWFVTSYAPEGAIEAVFVAPRPIRPEHAAAWSAALRGDARHARG